MGLQREEWSSSPLKSSLSKAALDTARYVLVVTGSIVLTGVLSSDLRAEPYLAIREGFKCSQCHVSPTGGGKRNAFGIVYQQTRLLFGRRPDSFDEISKEAQRFVSDPFATFAEGEIVSPFLTEHISLGGDLRVRATESFGDESVQRGSFDLEDGRIYAQFDVNPKHVTFYLDQTITSQSSSPREFYALLHDLPGGAYVKAGKFVLPFGLRLVDDDAFIRKVPGINYNTSDTGVEVGVEPGPLSVSIAFTNGSGGGSDQDEGKEVSAVQSLVFRRFRVGTSFSHNDTDAGYRTAFGTFGGLHVGRFTWLGEFDTIWDHDDGTNDTLRQLATLFETNFLVVPGINLKNTLEFLDPDRSVDDNARIRVGAGVEFFPTQAVQVTLMWRGQDSIPQLPLEGTDVLFLELHIFL